MEVILKQPVRNLGDMDDIVRVKPGYARNYLIPQGFAVMATASNRKALQEKKKQAAHKQEFIKNTAQELADQIAGNKIVIETLAGADGKLFGSVTTLQIANRLKDMGFDIDRKMITFEDIRNTGEYTATIHLHKEVKAELEIEVIRKGGEE